ncbi:MAG: hypothetical protein CVV24_05830 [Ignavibacteriae bacterium HGW-Ignavibacteriae-3]|nr:MAG: hypothetical protein CVV24_05830 [Ignavibacteriae bacterium HGW-Ignavibacteriae-3]
MIFVSINTEEKICKINIHNGLVSVSLTLILADARKTLLSTLAIFIELFKGVIILWTRMILSAFNRDTIRKYPEIL